MALIPEKSQKSYDNRIGNCLILGTHNNGQEAGAAIMHDSSCVFEIIQAFFLPPQQSRRLL